MFHFWFSLESILWSCCHHTVSSAINLILILLYYYLHNLTVLCWIWKISSTVYWVKWSFFAIECVLKHQNSTWQHWIIICRNDISLKLRRLYFVTIYRRTIAYLKLWSKFSPYLDWDLDSDFKLYSTQTHKFRFTSFWIVWTYYLGMLTMFRHIDTTNWEHQQNR